ncbi:MAG: tripartite tricarboxylate transporter substrate binding protein [Lachnospiraceae bacterium]|jgi:putative tricarboxylic transport membrane protein|nr:tripartite tricarboxylate transporter substrate binding protein [Lachnospiraceae bacterium]
MKKKLLAIVLAGVMACSLAGCGSGGGSGSNWAKNVEVQVPAKAGGGTDVMARALGTQVAKDSGSTITIVNNTDGGGVVACEKGAAGKKDGSTLVQFHTTLLIKTATGVLKKSAADDFTVIAVGVPVDEANNVLVVSGDSPYETLNDLIEDAKANPGSLLVGIETGGTTHVQAGLFAKAAGLDVKYVEAGSDTEKLTALVGNSINAALVNANQAKQYIESGKAKALAVVSNSPDGGRSSVLPDVPSFVEQGVDCSFQMLSVLLLGPKDMDPQLVNQIHDYYAAAAENEEVKATLSPAGMEMTFMSVEEGLKTVQDTQTSVNTVVEELGLKQE